MNSPGARTHDLVLGIDAGTGGVRACLFDLVGTALGVADRPLETTFPRPGWATQNPEAWWAALVDATRAALMRAGVDGHRVIGLSVDAPCDILLAANDGTPLTEALMWMDLRGASRAKRLTASNDPVLRYCGGEVPAEWPLPKALWLHDHDAAWRSAPRLVEQMTWLTWRLTDEWVAPLNSAAAKWQYRPGDGWPRTMLRSVGLEDAIEKLPQRVVAMGQRGGDLSASAAAALGLRPGIAVAMSGIDAHTGMLGVGVTAPGTLALITGTSTCQLVQSVDPVFDSGLWGPFEDAVIAGQWTVEAGQSSTGGTVRWLLDLVGARWKAAQRYAEADDEASKIAPGADGLVMLDFWQGSRTPVKDASARGTLWGLTNGHSAAHLLRSVYEGTAYGNRNILEALSANGIRSKRIVACGGGTRSALWLQILADVAKVPIEYSTSDDAVGLGTAICAAVGAGAFPNLAAAAASMARAEKTVEPNPELADTYDAGFALYLETYAALAPIFAKTAQA
ncbi:MAG: xylulose kinase [Candidatus Eremiobacteraeota bacterium]|nr:xylulose kinase [Candidatus Eremiobacteraeota bacterium]